MEKAGPPHPRFTTGVADARSTGSWAWPTTLVVHGLFVLAVLIVPLLAEEQLPSESTSTAKAFFVAPTLGAAPPPPPPPAAARPATAPRVAAKEPSSSFMAPVETPAAIVEDPSLDLGLEGGVPGGVEGGVPGGVVGGIVGGLDTAPPPPPPQVIRVGGTIQPPRKLKDVAPVYPRMALDAKIQGVVILECRVSPAGRVESVQVLRGVPTLDDAAVNAVKQWVYTPTLMGGVPVGVVMTVTVNFVVGATPFSR
jgi:periplasmic protein TonB